MCGEDADTGQGTYCAEHRPLVTDRPPRAREPRHEGGQPDVVVESLAANLELQLGLVASMWTLRDPVCGGALATSAPNIAEYWANRARSSPAIARALDQALGAGGILAGIAVHAPLLLAVMSHHVAPAIEARRQALATEPAPPPMPTYAEDGTYPAPASGNAAPTWLDGTMEDAAAEAARRAFVADQLGVDLASPDGGPGEWAVPAPGEAPVWIPTAGDAELAWQSAQEVAAAEAAAGMPWGVATDGGVPSWEAPASDGRG